MVPKWNQNGGKNPGISWTFRATLPRRLQGDQMEVKELQNGAKMEANRSRMDRKWTSKRSKIDKKSMKNEAVECDGELRFGMASIRCLMDFHWISNRFC